MMRRHTLLVWSCLIVFGMAACSPSTTAHERAMYKATPLKGEPHVTFSTTADELLIDITSPTGIGSTTIEKTAGQWPPRIVMRLHVNALESFKFHYADTVIDVNVSSHGDHAVSETFEAPRRMGTASAGDPYWIAVTPGQGYFDLEAPADFLKSGENQFTIEWIDFYR